MKKTSTPVASTRAVDSMMAGVTKQRSSPMTVWFSVTYWRVSGYRNGWYCSSPSICSTCIKYIFLKTGNLLIYLLL